jgi:dihydrolipoamide dehydrogenase
MATHSADVVVLGAGPAGYVCAIRLAQLGKKVTVIDRGMIGGVCLNVGCIPSKALIYAGSIFDRVVNHGSDFGIIVKDAKVDFAKMMEFKSGVVKKLTGGVGQLLKANGCNLLIGEARFTGPKAIELKTDKGTDTVTFNTCVVATGSRPTKLPGFEIDQKRVLDSTGALGLEKQPKSMLCIGGGYIGLELGTFYSKIGTKVTVVEAGPGLLGGVDPQLTQVVARSLQKRGVEVMTETLVQSHTVGKDGVEVTFKSKDGKTKTQTFETVLVTIGRTPNTDSLGLEKTGLKPDAKGFLTVDAQRRTSVPSLYAIGDVAGQPLLAHKASKEGVIAAEAIAGKKVAYDVLAMPAVIFTDPEIATVGLTEAEAKQKGFTVNVGTFPMVANGRALSVGEPDGMVKMIGDAKTGRLLGVHIVGAEASNLIAEAALAIEMGASVEDLALTVHAHPTLPETLMEAAEATLGHAIHIFQKKPAAGAQPQLQR